jgi:hypothetical protein
MDGATGAAESHTLRGAIDVTKLDAFRDAFLAIEPMASGTIDDRLDPRELRLTISYGVGEAERTVFTVRWTTVDDYNIHYWDTTESNLRWDSHRHDFSRPPADRHFHPPPDAASVDDRVEESCIETSRIPLVARTVHLLWRRALDEGSIAEMNAEPNPP